MTPNENAKVMVIVVMVMVRESVLSKIWRIVGFRRDRLICHCRIVRFEGTGDNGKGWGREEEADFNIVLYLGVGLFGGTY